MSERGYLEGVPLRLNSKFYPQPRPQFKEIDIHIPVDALQDEYDFSLERGTLMSVETWEEEHRQELVRRAAREKEEEEARLEKEKERKRFQEQERIRLAAEEVVRQAAEEVERVRCIEEEKDRIAAEEKARIRRAEEEKVRLEEEEKERIRFEAAEKVRLIAEEEERVRLRQVRLDDDNEDVSPPPIVIPPVSGISVPSHVINLGPDVPQPSSSPLPTAGYLSTNSQPQLGVGGVGPYHTPQQQQWNPNYYVPPTVSPSTAGDLISGQQVNNVTANPTTTCQPNAPPSSSVNSFKNYYFPLLTSMADSRLQRDRQQHQYPTDLGQNYNQLPANQQVSSSSQNNPYLSVCANPPPPPAIQHFPILGSLSQQPSNHIWPGETGIRSGMSYNTGHNPHPLLNGPLLGNDPSLLKTNGSRLPSPADNNLSASSAPNGTTHTHPSYTSINR